MGCAHCSHSDKKVFDEFSLLLLSLLLCRKLGTKRCVVFHQPFDLLHDYEVGLGLRIKERTTSEVARRFRQEVRMALVKRIDRMTVFAFFKHGLAGTRVPPVFFQVPQRPYLLSRLQGRQQPRQGVDEATVSWVRARLEVYGPQGVELDPVTVIMRRGKHGEYAAGMGPALVVPLRPIRQQQMRCVVMHGNEQLVKVIRQLVLFGGVELLKGIVSSDTNGGTRHCQVLFESSIRIASIVAKVNGLFKLAITVTKHKIHVANPHRPLSLQRKLVHGQSVTNFLLRETRFAYKWLRPLFQLVLGAQCTSEDRRGGGTLNTSCMTSLRGL